jgi:hypothetical protein
MASAKREGREGMVLTSLIEMLSTRYYRENGFLPVETKPKRSRYENCSDLFNYVKYYPDLRNLPPTEPMYVQTQAPLRWVIES